MTVVLYRYVDRQDVEAILADGFLDAEWPIGTDDQGKAFKMSGVGFSDRPEYQFAGQNRTLLRVTLPVGEEAIARWEIQQEGSPYREWCIPARFVNPIATVKIEPEEESETPAGTTEATTVARPSAPAIAGKFPGLFKPAPGRPGRTEVTLPAPKKPRD